MTQMIKVEKVSKEYKVYVKKKFKNPYKIIKNFISPEFKKVNAVKNLNFEISKGEIIGFIGSNGAGKSTSIKLLTGLITPTNGQISVNEMDPFKNRIELSKNTGILMGNKSHLWWDLPLKESFNLLKVIYQIPNSQFEEWSKYLYKLMRVEEFLNTPVRQLSLGQRMRGELIATFLHKPSLVYLDEPSIGLDIESKKIVNDFILKINKDFNTTIILTTHEIMDIQKVCERMILIENGSIIYDGMVSDFINRYKKYKVMIIDTFDKHHTPLLPSNIKLIEDNVSSKEYLFDSKEVDEQGMLKLTYKIKGISNIRFKEIDLPIILKMLVKEDSTYESK